MRMAISPRLAIKTFFSIHYSPITILPASETLVVGMP